MVATYTGILREEGRIEWDGPVPADNGAHVTMTFIEELPVPMQVSTEQPVTGAPQREARLNSNSAP